MASNISLDAASLLALVLEGVAYGDKQFLRPMPTELKFPL